MSRHLVPVHPVGAHSIALAQNLAPVHNADLVRLWLNCRIPGAMIWCGSNLLEATRGPSRDEAIEETDTNVKIVEEG